MKILKKLAGLIIALSICLSASVMTVSAHRTQLMGLSDEEVKESVWEDVLAQFNFKNTDDTFGVTFTYYNLNEFLKTLEIPNMDYDSMDACHDFLEWRDELYKNQTIEEYGDGLIQYDNNNPDEKLYWKYVESTDRWVCKDKDGNTIKMMDVYHLDNETSSTTTSSSKPSEQSSTVSTTSNPGGTVSAEPQPEYPGSTPDMPDSPGSTNTEVSSSPVDEPATESPDSSNTEVSSSPVEAPATDSTVSDSPATEEAVTDQTVSAEEVEPNNNNVMQTVLIIIGILIIAGIIVIIVMLNKRKREDNNGK